PCCVFLQLLAAYAPILPVEMVKEIPITVSYLVTGYYAEEIMKVYEETNNTVFLDLYVEEKPEWCTVSILPPTLVMPTTTSLKTANATLSVTVNENAFAFSESTIKIRVNVKGIGAIQGGTFCHDVLFIPGYLPILGINTPDGTTELVTPGATANFDIEIENLGNAKTEVVFRVLNVPKDWSPNIISNTVLGSKVHGDDPKSTVQLVVQPPYSFGYHNEREVIQVSMTPSYYADPTLKTKK
ncbi:hypothetical protein MBGDN05_00292, partial [Thermoplasmatales archaeon SCGC AB-539-N05]